MNKSEQMKILIPLDESPLGETALLSLLPLIRSRKVETTLLHVAQQAGASDKAKTLLDMRRKGLESQGVAAKVLVETGRPAEEILRLAKEGRFDLIAMATHGRSGMERVTLGSVAEDVVRGSPIPTLICKTGGRVGGWERILVALDGSPGSEEVLSDVARLARSINSTVHLVKVDPGFVLGDNYRGVELRPDDHASSTYIEEVALDLMSQGVPTFTERRTGFPADEISRLAAEIDAGLICMTTEGRPEGSPGMDHSVAAKVIRMAPCPVFVRHMVGAAGARTTRRKATNAR
jgi:nucleotide-binding universal stress UspA family protein